MLVLPALSSNHITFRPPLPAQVRALLSAHGYKRFSRRFGFGGSNDVWVRPDLASTAKQRSLHCQQCVPAKAKDYPEVALEAAANKAIAEGSFECYDDFLQMQSSSRVV